MVAEKISEIIGQEKLDAIVNTMVNLYCRWQDEKEYEDFEDYKNVVKKMLPENCPMVGMKKSPFVVEFKLPDGRIAFMKANSREVVWGVKPVRM
jgi:hypothetical protein